MRVRFRGRQGGRRVDLVLGLLLLAGVLTGVAANTIGVNWPLDLMQLHAGAALAILLLAPWKYVVIRRGLRNRRRRGSVKWLSISLVILVLVAIGTGLLHATGRVEFVGPLTLMQIHVVSAVAALLVVIVHFFVHAVRPRRADADRRALLGLGMLSAAATIATVAWNRGVATPRRFTGSVPKATLEFTSWIDDSIQIIDPGTWSVRVGDVALDLATVLALPHERFPAVLDCTSGWYSDQEWDGVRLRVLLHAAGVSTAHWRSVAVRSATGYTRWFGISTLDDVWLVTGVGGQALPYGSGYPARIVAPGRRGFWWVKWVSSVQPSMLPPWAQSVFPLT